MPANASQNESPLSTWALDREIVLSRVINAPLVFSAWADPRHLPNGSVLQVSGSSQSQWILASTANGVSI
jgi:hypothetical protein